MAKVFDKIVEDEFRFLSTDFGFHLDRCKKINGGFDILYINDVCGVHIFYEFREAYLFITLHKLQKGKFVDNPGQIRDDSVVTGFSLDDIIMQRNPSIL